MSIRRTSCRCYHFADEKMEAVRMTTSWRFIVCVFLLGAESVLGRAVAHVWQRGVGPVLQNSPPGEAHPPQGELPSWSGLLSLRARLFSCCSSLPFQFFGRTFPLSGYRLGFFGVGGRGSCCDSIQKTPHCIWWLLGG